jgi:hypothetical protein
LQFPNIIDLSAIPFNTSVQKKAIYPKLILVGIRFFGGTRLSIIIAHSVLVNIDVLLARIVLTPEESGIYTVGMLVAKIAFLCPKQ